MPFTQYGIGVMLNAWSGAGTSAFTTYAGLHTGGTYTDPSSFVAGAEVTGGSYTRQQVYWTAPSSQLGGYRISNAIGFLYNNLPACTLQAVIVWDALTGGNPVGYWPIDAPGLAVPAQGTLAFYGGDIRLTLTGIA